MDAKRYYLHMASWPNLPLLMMMSKSHLKKGSPTINAQLYDVICHVVYMFPNKILSVPNILCSRELLSNQRRP